MRLRPSERRDTFLNQNPPPDTAMSLRACFENGCGGRPARYLFSAPTKNWLEGRDLFRRNAGTADPLWEVSRHRRQPTFLRTEVRAPFARGAITLNPYSARPGRRPADWNCREQRCEKAVLIASNCRFRFVRRVAGYVFSVAACWSSQARSLAIWNWRYAKPTTPCRLRGWWWPLALAAAAAAFSARTMRVWAAWTVSSRWTFTFRAVRRIRTRCCTAFSWQPED
jgi:hypothetical protein